MQNTKRIPLILTGHALKSLRDSGYTLPAALGEPIDNCLEANANNIHIKFEEDSAGGKKHIHAIAIIDDGDSMNDDVLQHYLQLGYSTRYGSTTTIGKYGVGAKLAAMNFGRRIDVWAKLRAEKEYRHTYLDLDEALELEQGGDEAGIGPPDSTEPPSWVKKIANGGPGTIVVWSKVDRLEDGRFAPTADELRADVRKELSRTFRDFITDGIKITIDGVPLLAHDPLAIQKGTWIDTELAKKPEHKKERRDHFPASIITKDEEISVGTGTALLTVTVYPPEIVRKRGTGGDELAKKLRVPENEGAISFVRMNREIAYTNVPKILPLGVLDIDRFIGIEVRFKPDLDAFFGVRNVKRGVEPHGDLRAKIRERLAKYIPTARNKVEEIRGAVQKEDEETTGQHGAATSAVSQANKTLPKSRATPPKDESEQQRVLKLLAKDMGITDDKKVEDYVQRNKDLPFVVENVDFPGTNFIDLVHLGHQVVVRVNTRHRFYRELWEPIRETASRAPGTMTTDEIARIAKRTDEAIFLIIVAYAKAESMHTTPDAHYKDLRSFWGQFVDTLMDKVKNV
ncbi:MAG: ATP-binding protein [Deltaproteobacteria bacterium]|nr:ATP-binding protein [Deltaproteobacteria bacterium]